jgi:TonB-dependent SusC/RagA subfamily outer membrane receptor
VGYGTQRRRAVTGSVSKISTSELTSNGTVQSALQGRVSGLSITGDYNSVHVRGTTSIRGANEPMYILDGVPIDATTAMTMPTSNIASITIVKDATASAIYGSRAANGVIIIETKRAPLSYSAPVKEDAKQEIIDSFEALSNSVTYDRYIEMKKYKKNIPAFYFTMAAYFYKHKQPKEALRILSNLAVIQPENHQLLRTIGYVLEEWNDYDNATEIYEMVLAIKEEEPQSYRDLALSYAFNGNQQEAFKLLYKGLSKDWGLYENRYNGLREIMMTELNILAGKEAVKATNVDTSLLKLLPVDLRIVIDWNKDETDIDLHIKEPGGEQSSYNNKVTKSGGRLSNDFTQGYGPEVYEIKNAKKGVYEVKINYYGDRYQKEKLPSFIKLTVFKNYGRPNQTVTIKTVLLDDDEGMIDLAEVKF